MTQQRCQVLVIGTGMAGLSAAIEAARANVDVVVLAKGPISTAHSHHGTGMNGTLASDQWRRHAIATIKASAYLADQDSVIEMCHGAAEVVEDLVALGAPLDRSKIGALPGRSYYHLPGLSGATAIQVLGEHLAHRNVPIIEARADSLVVADGQCLGADVVARNGDCIRYLSDATILCTGAAGQLYSPTTTSSPCTGDGLALAWRAGAVLADLEMTQFHPTAMHDGTLISELARGFGAVLINAQGTAFMEAYAPSARDRAPRDVVSSAIWSEASAGRAFPGGAVHLDFSGVGADQWTNEQLMSIREACLRVDQTDIRRHPVAVQPAMHYLMGGVLTDRWCATTVPRLLAAGEVACVSVHGANRLGGNSLLDARFFGVRAGRVAAQLAKEKPVQQRPPACPEPAIRHELDRQVACDDDPTRSKIGELMREFVGPTRTAETLQHAQEVLLNLRSTATPSGSPTSPELQSLLEIAPLVAACGLHRRESRGAHRRADYPNRNDEQYLQHTTVSRLPDGRPQLGSVPVRTTVLRPGPRRY